VYEEVNDKQDVAVRAERPRVGAIDFSRLWIRLVKNLRHASLTVVYSIL